jgi:hypothetical protein
MTDSETGSRHPVTRVEPPPWTGLHRLGLTGLAVLAATALPAIVHLVAPGADSGRIGLGIAGAERVEVAGEGTLVAHTAAATSVSNGRSRSRQIGGAAGRWPRVTTAIAPPCTDQKRRRSEPWNTTSFG